jgi:hypothetical protein
MSSPDIAVDPLIGTTVDGRVEMKNHLDDGNRYSVSDVAATPARYTYDRNDQWIGFAKAAHAAMLLSL